MSGKEQERGEERVTNLLFGTWRIPSCAFFRPAGILSLYIVRVEYTGRNQSNFRGEHMKNKIKYAWLLLQITLMTGLSSIVSWADETEAEEDEVIDFIKNGPGSGARDPFSKATDMVKNTGASFYQLAMAVTVVIMIVCFIAAGLRYAWCKGQRREESKDNILAAFVGGTIAFAACSLVLLVKNIAGGLF